MWISNSMNNFMETNAYWIDPRGELIEVKDTHVDTALKSKRRFGASSDEASLSQFDREDVILSRLVRSDWIRIRYQEDYYFIAVKELAWCKCKKSLVSWASSIISLHEGRISTVCIIEELSTGVVSKMLLGNIGKADFTHDESIIVNSASMSYYKDWSLIYGSAVKRASI